MSEDYINGRKHAAVAMLQEALHKTTGATDDILVNRRYLQWVIDDYTAQKERADFLLKQTRTLFDDAMVGQEALQKRLKVAAARETMLMEALNILASHGTHHDTNPTRQLVLQGPCRDKFMEHDTWWLTYFQGADKMVRDYARKALDKLKKSYG